MAEKKHAVCQLCGKPSLMIICEACGERLRGAALEKKRKEEKAASGAGSGLAHKSAGTRHGGD